MAPSPFTWDTGPEIDEDIATREREENAFSETHPAPADLKEKLDRARRQPQSR